MLRFSLSLACLALLVPACLGQTRVEASDLRNHPFSVDFASQGRLKLRVRSGEVHVVGVSEDRISVEISGRNAYEARDVKVRFERKDGEGSLRISGGPRNGVTITVRIPAKTDLYARVPFGEVNVEKVSGNQDVEVHAGELTLEVGRTADYSRVDASVLTGELDASAFGETHGGLFRSFRRTGPGRYRLHAHIGAGQLTLR